MPNDVQTLLSILRVVLVIAAVSVTVFPLLYGLFSPWYKSHLGRAVLLEALSVAFAIDISAYAQFFRTTTNALTIFWVNVSFLVVISLASLYLTAALLYYNFRTNKEQANV
jgi:hypothetical protein